MVSQSQSLSQVSTHLLAPPGPLSDGKVFQWFQSVMRMLQNWQSAQPGLECKKYCLSQPGDYLAEYWLWLVSLPTRKPSAFLSNKSGLAESRGEHWAVWLTCFKVTVGVREGSGGSLDVEIPLDKSPVPWLSTGCLAGDTIALISPVFRREL